MPKRLCVRLTAAQWAELKAAQEAKNPRPQPDHALTRQGSDRPKRDPDLKQGDAARKAVVTREELVGLV